MWIWGLYHANPGPQLFWFWISQFIVSRQSQCRIRTWLSLSPTGEIIPWCCSCPGYLPPKSGFNCDSHDSSTKTNISSFLVISLEANWNKTNFSEYLQPQPDGSRSLGLEAEAQHLNISCFHKVRHKSERFESLRSESCTTHLYMSWNILEKNIKHPAKQACQEAVFLHS